MARPKTVDPAALKRVSAGTYRTGDGRFTVEQASGRWLVTDEAQRDDLGLALVRGPYETLEAARGAIETARSGPAPTSSLGARLGGAGREPARGPAREAAGTARRSRSDERAAATPAATPAAAPIEIRRYRRGDGPAMRVLWSEVGLASVGDDDDALDLLSERNPGLVLVAARADRIVGTVLGGWDGRRGWLYHVATAPDHRRGGLGRRLVHEVERKLRALGCPKVNVIVRDGNAGGSAFWEALGYTAAPARQMGREL